MKLNVILFLLLASVVIKQADSQPGTLKECQVKALGELKENHIEFWNSRDNECYSTPNGMHYSGKVSVTKNGRTCQAWIANTPHEPSEDAKNNCNYPERSREHANNFCRNPDNSEGGPWCYTTDPNEKWEYCAIPKCPSNLQSCQANSKGELENNHIEHWDKRDTNCYSTPHGMYYSGKVSVTKNGRICQAWIANTPHQPKDEALNDCNYPERSRVKAGNYCRNPHNSDEGPWCYTTDPNVRSETCAIEKCPSNLESCQANSKAELKNNHIEHWDKRDTNCYSTPHGMYYSGKVSVTKNGRICQAWIANTPHVPRDDALNDCNYPERSRILAGNYCRNPDDSVEGPWCYTTDPNVRYETCAIQECPKFG